MKNSCRQTPGLTSRKKLHDEVQVHLVLEAVEHLDHPQAVCLHQDVPLSTNVTDLQTQTNQVQGGINVRQTSIKRDNDGQTDEPLSADEEQLSTAGTPRSHLLLLQHVSFAKDFHGVDMARVFLLYQADLEGQQSV